MVLLVQKFAKFYSKLDNHHHRDRHESEELSTYLEAFRSEISKLIAQLGSNLKPGSENLSLAWIENLFGLLPLVNKAFAKLVVDIDYPMSKWEADSSELYLSYSLILLEILNSISASISWLGKSRISLSHGLNLLENSSSLATKHLKEIPSGGFSINFSKELASENDDEARGFSGKERVIYEAVKELKKIGFWVSGILLSGLCSDSEAYKEMMKMAGGFDNSAVSILDSRISEKLSEKMPILEEVKEINDAVANILGASDPVKNEAAKELKTKLDGFEKLLEDLRKEVDDLFGKIMAHRNQSIDCFRLRMQSHKSKV